VRRSTPSTRASSKRLTYYKAAEIAALKALPACPELLLTHDWPKLPSYLGKSANDRPEADLVETLRPKFVCCGHHHMQESFRFERTEVRALNILTEEKGNSVNAGWCVLFRWQPGSLTEMT